MGMIPQNPGRIRRDLQIAEQRANGMITTDIAASHGISHQRVSQILSDDKIKAILDKTHRRYAAAATGIGKEFIKLCLDDDKDIKSRNIREYHKIMGIAPNHSASVFIQNIYNTTNHLEIHSNVTELMDHKRSMGNARVFDIGGDDG